ncbi:hypothetical protein [Microbacterium deminutum]|uniref:Uncharacterized protein n=1 Tax=Microbacterium deminutum TaxID=344164 RepID=A0ABP5C8A9_9MICO
MIADPRNAQTWTVLSQTTRAERVMLTLMRWLSTITHPRHI